jgi:thioredoxin reductase
VAVESLLVWGIAVLVVLSIVVPYVWRFRLRARRDRVRKAEAARLGIDRPSAQFPYIDPHHCVGCGACAEACPEGDVLGVVGGVAVVVNGLRCVGHALCEEACPVSAIEVGLGDLKSRQDVPLLDERFQTSIEGLWVAGELGGLSLVRNAVRQGRVAAEGAAHVIRAMQPRSSDELLDLAIVGAGPAGISAALTAATHGLSYVTLEREPDLGGTLLHYPRRKMVLTQIVEIPPWGSLERDEYSKEALLEIFSRIVGRHAVNIRFDSGVEEIVRENGKFRIRSTNGVFVARTVLLAQGRRGIPRKLGVPGEELPKVMYRLIDAASYEGQRILVVGGGDSAVEAALGLARQPTNDVTLSYRREKLVRIKKKNQVAMDRALASGRLQALFGSQVRQIGEQTVELRETDGTTRTIPNDYVFVFAGGIPPFELLNQLGARFGGESD